MSFNYDFCHNVLPKLVFGEPERCEGFRTDPAQTLEELWPTILENLDPENRDGKPPGVEIHGDVTLFCLTGPERMTEAFFVAIHWTDAGPGYHTFRTQPGPIQW